MKIRWIEERQGLWTLVGLFFAAIGVVVTIFQFTKEERLNPNATSNTPYNVSNQKQVLINQKIPSTTQSETSSIQKNMDIGSASNAMQDSQNKSKNRVMRWGEEWGKGVLTR